MQTTSQPSVMTSVSASTSQMRVPDDLEFLRSIASSASGVNDAVAEGIGGYCASPGGLVHLHQDRYRWRCDRV
jgi:hypothetical protein